MYKKFSLVFALIVIFNNLAIAQGGSTAGRAVKLEPCEVPGARPNVKEKVLCGTYEVFEDRSAKTGRKIQLKIVVFPATGQNKAADPLFYIPGGPGSSATEEAPFMAQDWAKIRDNRDLVFVDQRGTGGSNPLNCELYDPKDLNSYLGSYFPLDDVRKCRAKLEPAADLRLYGTEIAMDDLNDVRTALGYDQINIAGGSYGTRAALVYLKRHPSSVRAMLLQGVQPTDQPVPRDFPEQTERALQGVLDECLADKDCSAAFPNIKAEAKSLLKRLIAGAVEVDITDPKGGATRVKVSRDLAAEAIRYMLYSPSGAGRVPLYLHQAATGNFAPLAEAVIMFRRRLGTGANGMYLSVTCSEDLPQIKPGEGERNDNDAFLSVYRLHQQRAACELWPRTKLSKDFAKPTRGNTNVLMLSGQWDPVTPPMYAAAAAKHLPNSLHVIVPSGGHGFGGLDGLQCIQEISAKFIADGTVRGLDPSCVKNIRRRGFALKLPGSK